MAMLKRTVTGVVLTGMLLLFLWLSSLGEGYLAALPIDLLIVLFAWAATYEMYHVTKKSGYNPVAIAVLVCAIIIYPVTIFVFKASYVGIFLTVLTMILVAFFFFIFNMKTPHTLNDFTLTTFIFIYPLGLMMVYAVLNNKYGVIPPMLAIAAGLMSDTFAYFIGSILKGPKLFPKISPKKTVSGCVAGLFGGAAGALVVYGLFEVAGYPANTPFMFSTAVSAFGVVINPYLVYCLLGFAFSFFAEIGDLAASKIKRQIGIKDYGTIFGGHGGVMDRIDSLLFTLVPLTVFMVLVYPA